MKKLNVLILDDESMYTDKLTRFLDNSNLKSYVANAPSEAFKILDSCDIDILVCDYVLPEMNGLEVLSKVKSKCPEIEVIMISGHGDMDTVIKATRLGAIDFIKKPLRMIDIQLAIERTSKYLNLQSKYHNLEKDWSLISRQLEGLIQREFIGTSDAIQKVRDMALMAARDKDVNILITGENGTGKEIVARIIHYSSERSTKAFYPVNSAAIPETLLESEFFGHMRGAFTDAREDRKGCFELANGGTLFLDEISEMPVSLQAKLLRSIEESIIRPVGGKQEIKVDVRLISATNKDLESLIRDKKFRLDLYHRINTFLIHIPPLRERREDIEPLLYYFTEDFSRKKNILKPDVETGVLDELLNYSFPGNVRELKNMVERAMILSEGNILKLKDFPVENHKPGKLDDIPATYNLQQIERETIVRALRVSGYNQVKAARLLGVSRDTLIRKRKKYKISIEKNITP